jgi:hypothetical protein
LVLRVDEHVAELHLAIMRWVLAAYDAHLRRKAQQTAVRRLRAFRGILAPWALASFLALILFRTLGGPLWSLPLFGLLLIGASWATNRFNKYGWEFERTPPAAPWTTEKKGQTLIRALGRVTLNSLTTVTLQTRLREDLKLTNRDIFELFAILKKEVNVDEHVVERGLKGGLTVGSLLDGMHTYEAHSELPKGDGPNV